MFLYKINWRLLVKFAELVQRDVVRGFLDLCRFSDHSDLLKSRLNPRHQYYIVYSSWNPILTGQREPIHYGLLFPSVLQRLLNYWMKYNMPAFVPVGFFACLCRDLCARVCRSVFPMAARTFLCMSPSGSLSPCDLTPILSLSQYLPMPLCIRDSAVSECSAWCLQ